MSGTIKYGKEGAYVADVKAKNEAYSESGEHIADPTAMSGTLETSGTTGEVETAEDVSPIFEVADQIAAENEGTEGDLGAADADTTDDTTVDEGEADKYDPTAKKVAEVLDYLKTADDREVKRVIAAEKKGDGRKTIVEYKKS